MLDKLPRKPANRRAANIHNRIYIYKRCATTTAQSNLRTGLSFRNEIFLFFVPSAEDSPRLLVVGFG